MIYFSSTNSFLFFPTAQEKERQLEPKLAKSNDLSLSDKTQQLPSGNKKIDESTAQCVKKFYFQDSISRQAPGLHDYVIVRERGTKSKSLKETLELWSDIWNVSYIELRIWNQVSYDHCSYERNLTRCSLEPRTNNIVQCGHSGQRSSTHHNL